MIKRIGRKTLFRVNVPDVDEVYLAGDFNNWTIPGVAMTQVDRGVWEAGIPLPGGPQRVGYFALKQNRPEAPAPNPDPEQPVATISGSWLDEYESLVVDDRSLVGAEL